MTKEDTKTFLKKILALFPSTPIPTPDTIEEWHRALEQMTINQCMDYFHDYLKTNKFAPSISDIYDRYVTDMKIQKDLSIGKTEDCKVCEGKGFVMYKKNVNGSIYEFVARCNCTNARQYSKEIPTIDAIIDTSDYIQETNKENMKNKASEGNIFLKVGELLHS
jgi:hypothetical protein